MVIVVTGVVLLAAAAFVVSYAGIRQVAVAAGVSPALAGLYPLIVDAVLVVACVAGLALRGAGWQVQGYAWLSVIVLLAVVAVAGAVHAAGIGLPHRPAAAAVAALPWVLFLLAFGLCLFMLRHLRMARATNPPGDPGAASWWPWNADPDTADVTPLPAPPMPASSGTDPQTADARPRTTCPGLDERDSRIRHRPQTYADAQREWCFSGVKSGHDSRNAAGQPPQPAGLTPRRGAARGVRRHLQRSPLTGHSPRTYLGAVRAYLPGSSRPRPTATR